MQIIVLGMHRSGTSAVARLLNMMGAYFAPPELAMPANEDNEKGYWERWDVFGLHEDMLRELGWAWDRISRFDARRLVEPDFVAKFRPQAERILLDLDARRPWMLKDPRINLLLPFWKPLLEAPVCVHVHRSPIQVAQSLHKREGFPLSLGLALWEQYSLLGLAHSEAIPRLLVSYHDLMTQPVETLQRLHAQLMELQVQGLRLPSAREIEAFIEPRLYHQQGDRVFQSGYANTQQAWLDQAFTTGDVLFLTPLPTLSVGATEILRGHEERHTLLTHFDHLRHRREQLGRVLHARKAAGVEQRARSETYEGYWRAAEERIAALEQAANERQAQAEERIAALEQAADERQAQAEERIAALKQVADERRAQAEAQIATLEQTARARQAQAKEQIAALEQAAREQQVEIERYRSQWQVAEGQVVALQQRLEQREQILERLQHWLVALAGNIEAIFGSLTWRAGNLLTRIALVLLWRKPDPGARGQILQILQDMAEWRRTHPSMNPPLALIPAQDRVPPGPARPERYAHLPVLTLPSASAYKKWYAHHRCKAEDLEQQRREIQEWPETPLVSLAIPCYNSPSHWLDALLASIHRQSYPDWECILVDDASSRSEHLAVIDRWRGQDSRFRLIQHDHNQGVGGASQTGLEAARGEYFAVVDHDDLLEPDALYEVAKTIREHHPDVMYSDEMLVRNNGRIIRCEFRPQFSYHFLLSHPYIVHLTAFRRDLLLQVGGFDQSLQVSQDYDLLLRVAAVTHDFRHIPKVLYQWRIHPASTGHQQMARVTENSLAALNRHLRLAGLAEDEALAVAGLSFNFFRIRYKIEPATVSIIIPTRDRVDLLRMCVESLLGRTRLPAGVALELIVANNGSSQPDTLAYFAELEKQGHRVVDAPGSFNFSRINNIAAARAQGEFLLFLNNDIEIVEPDWLEAMLEPMIWDNVGVVGAKLLYPDIGLIQHAGVVIGFNGIAAHDHQFYSEYENGRLAPGHHHALLAVRECMAVTAACMLIRREAFDKVGGFDTDLQVGFGDTDLCLRLRQAGYLCLFTPYARLIHHESATRGYDAVDTHPTDTQLFKERWAEQLVAGDPYYNPNLSLSGRLFAPRLG